METRRREIEAVVDQSSRDQTAADEANSASDQGLPEDFEHTRLESTQQRYRT
jgi:hypothetical protein